MNSIRSEFIEANDILNQFTKENPKFQARFISLYKDMVEFINASDFNDKVAINALSLGYTLVDYFEDVKRLKEFHHVNHINSIRIVSYTAYWLLRRKPIQLLVQDKQVLYVNERFVLSYILDFLSESEKGSVLLQNKSGLESFAELLFYFLKYRFTSATSLELVLTAFFAGQIYQNPEDISDKLGKYDEDH